MSCAPVSLYWLVYCRFALAGQNILIGLLFYLSYPRFFASLGLGHQKRYVLVITGFGPSPGSSAVLKQKVPRWLQLPNFQIWVSVFKEASRSHGGEGALYVRLRRDN